MKEYVYYCPEINELKVFEDLETVCGECPCKVLTVESKYKNVTPAIKVRYYYIGEL